MDRIDGSVPADAHRHQRDGRGAESRRFRKDAEGRAKILEDLLQAGPKPDRVSGFFDKADIPEFAERGEPGNFRIFAALDAIASSHSKVRADFFIEIRLPSTKTEHAAPYHGTTSRM